ncbi:cation-translocating P-type ATPase [Candidatus Woesearchaeota archaeon]|nr:cation-translocating P-type ATPase [Candidatus Woesearchaeota archaeon]
MDYYKLESDDVLKALGSSIEGLSEEEAKKLLIEHGLNEIRKTKDYSVMKSILSQFTDLMVIILIIASLISFFLGESADALVILGIVLLNALIGFFQEFKAEKSIEALQKLVSQTAIVIRDGAQKEIPSTQIVPGDVIVLEEGSKVPADARLLEEYILKTDESSLTGESIPQKKVVESISCDKVVCDQKNMVFLGTSVAHGRGIAVVVSTGHETEFGKIANLTTQTKTETSPLQKELLQVGKFIAKATFVLVFLVFIAGLLSGGTLLDMFLFSISMAVAAVPEGLPATVTIALALGVSRMAKKNAIIRRLSSVETLGCTNIICTDKTGTLTKNEMTVTQIYANNITIDISGVGYDPKGSLSVDGRRLKHEDLDEYEMLFNIAALVNNSELIKPSKKKSAWDILGDPTEGALLVAAKKIGIDHKALLKEYPKIDEIPFDSDRKRMITVHEHEKHNHAYMKGAFSEVIKLCDRISINGVVHKLTTQKIEELEKKNEEMAEKGLRVLAFSIKKVEKKYDVESIEKNMTFVGLIGMIDPPRHGVKEAVAMAKKAGIRVIVITGDFGVTAKAVAKQVGIISEDARIITGDELSSMSDEKLKKVLDTEVLFARVSPSHKLRIVKILESKDLVVAVTGDGVNDAPALKKASIGISMGLSGTDVSKEASNMVLADDSFVSIISAIKEGRTIYDNLKKFITYILSSNIGELVTVLLALIIGFPLPLLALQILLIDLGTDVLPSLALGVEPSEQGVMNRKPRDRKQKIMNKDLLSRLLMIGGVLGVGSLFLFYNTITSFGLSPFDKSIVGSAAYVKATTMVFVSLILFQMVNVFNCRSEKKSAYSVPFFSNPFLLFSVFSSVVISVLYVYLPFFNTFLHTSPIGFVDWAYILVIAFSINLADEARKFFIRRKEGLVVENVRVTQ